VTKKIINTILDEKILGRFDANKSPKLTSGMIANPRETLGQNIIPSIFCEFASKSQREERTNAVKVARTKNIVTGPAEVIKLLLIDY